MASAGVGVRHDVVGLYLSPSEHAVVFSADEKPHIQAIERSALVLPMVPGTPERRSHDYHRHGTIDLFAAPVVHEWLLAHPTVHLHFTPTYSSWINQVERWFAELQRRRLDRGVFCSLDELTTALQEWLKHWNENARPFNWTKDAGQILDSIGRYCARISGPGH